MPLTPGTRLSAYEIVGLLGAGGMGEVYRARDPRLNREVALKVLPAAVADDLDRLARFEREAQLLAAFNHPNIAAIYGVEESGNTPALVMELVEGPTLADRISDGAVPLDEALRIARQIAEALEAAHQRGIVHRDLKPANIKVRADGTVKVLDFGLAKPLDLPGGTATRPSLTNSPTLTSPAMMTGVGVLLGTAAYMSPEQAKGLPADKGSDTWAFGCVCYEMLTGHRAFDGETAAEVLASVLRSDPAWDRLPIGTPASLTRLLKALLNKTTADRVQDAAVIRYVLESDLALTSARSAAPRRFVVPLLILGSAIAVGSLLAFAWVGRPSEVRPPPTRHLTLSAAVDHPFTVPGAGGIFRTFAIAPDAAFVVYRSSDGSLVVRYLDGRPPTILAAGRGVQNPFVSPNGQWIGFVSGNNDLQKVPVSGGAPTTICHIDSSVRGASWSSDEFVYFATADPDTGIWRVPATGGEPRVVTRPDKAHGEIDHVLPFAAPGGGVLFTVLRRGNGGMDIAAVDSGASPPLTLVSGGSNGIFGGGHLVVSIGGSLRAMTFDPVRMQVGDGFTVADDVETKPLGAANFDVASDGTLVFERRPPESLSSLAWVNRAGVETPVGAPLRGYRTLRLAPDATRVATEIRTRSDDGAIWVWDFARQTLTRLLYEGGVAQRPVWTPDSRRVLFSGTATGQFNLWWQMADGSGPAEALIPSARRQIPTSVSRDGSRVLFAEYGSGVASDDIRMMAAKDRSVTTLLGTGYAEQNGELSPDGHFVAYDSDESGRREVYVRPFPDLNAGRWQISTNGGVWPRWRADGRELFYVDGRNKVVAVGVSSGEFRAGREVELFAVDVLEGGGGFGGSYDATPDGNRFLVVKRSTNGVASVPLLDIVLNKIAPPGGVR